MINTLLNIEFKELLIVQYIMPQAKIRIIKVSAEEVARVKSNTSSSRTTPEKANSNRRAGAATPKTATRRRTLSAVKDSTRPADTIPMWKVLIAGKVYLMDSANRIFT